MTDKKYYWKGPGNYGGGKNAITKGEEMPKDADIEFLLSKGKVSTEKTVTERQLSRLEELEAENKILKGSNSEESKLIADNELLAEKVAELESGGDSGITQEQLDEAKSELQGTLDLIKESLAKIQKGDSKAEIWDAVKSVKDLIEG